MNDAALNKWIKRLLNNPQISDTTLTEAKTESINQVANILVASAPEYFEKKKSLTYGNTNIFTWPTDLLMLKQVWDYGKNALTVTGTAANADGSVDLTISSHGISTDTVVTVHDIVGTTEANGTWLGSMVDADTLNLEGTTYANAWTSGGKVYLEQAETYKYPLNRIPSNFESQDDDERYFFREDDIIVNDPDFDNDLIILYRYLPSALTEIPSRFHSGVYAYSFLLLAEFEEPTIRQDETVIQSASEKTLRKNIKICEGVWNRAIEMAKSFRPVKSSNNISDRKIVKRWL